MPTTKFMKSKNECKQNGKERQSRSRKFTSISQRENGELYCILTIFTVVCTFLIFLIDVISRVWFLSLIAFRKKWKHTIS